MQWRGSSGELSMSPASDASLSTAGRPNGLEQPVGLSAISMLSPATLMDCPQQGHHWQGALPRFCRFLLTSPLWPGLPWQAPVLATGGLGFHSAQRMRELGKYHARGIHSWDGGQCSFHPSVVCSCGGCDDGDDLQCVGKPYESKFVLSCELHSLGYEIECEQRALNAESVIHTVMGRGHSNLCEAAFNILPRFHAKSLALHRLSYITLTNWGLIMSCVEKSDISPYVSLFSQMGLPVLDGMADIWKADIEEKSKALEKKKTDEVKKYRIQMMTARVAEQQERKQWTKRQQILHSYGNQEEELEPTEEADPLDSDASVYALLLAVSIVQKVRTVETYWFWGIAYPLQVLNSHQLSLQEKRRSGNHASVAPHHIPVCLFMVAH